MIDKDELIRIAKKEKLPLGTIEKDFVLTYILKKIYESDLKDKLIFKGGTALHKLYLHKRMSIDLDFTEARPIKLNEIRKIIEDKSINSKIKEMVRTGKSTKIVLSYVSVLEYKNNIVLDISKREKPTQKLVAKKLKSFYSKPVEILTFQLEELIAEKIRAIVQRKRPRDYLDVYYILNKKNFDFKKSLEIAKLKLKTDSDNFDIERIFSDLDIIESMWEYDLVTILPNVPNFGKVIQKLKKKFEYFK